MRRWVQISVRGFLVMTTVVGIAIGVVVEREQRHRNFIKRLIIHDDAGAYAGWHGHAWYGSDRPAHAVDIFVDPVERWATSPSRLKERRLWFDTIRTVRLHRDPLPRLREARSLGTVEYLACGETCDDVLRIVATMHSVKYLQCEFAADVTVDGISHLASSGVEQLLLRNMTMDRDLLLALNGLTNVEKLGLEVDNEHVVIENLQGWKELYFSRGNRYRGRYWQTMSIGNIACLRLLDLAWPATGYYSFYHDVAPSRPLHISIRDLPVCADLILPPVFADSIAICNLPQLRELDIWRTDQLYLSGLTGLRHLALLGSESLFIDDATIHSIEELTLKSVHFNRTVIDQLSKARQLRRLSILGPMDHEGNAPDPQQLSDFIARFSLLEVLRTDGLGGDGAAWDGLLANLPNLRELHLKDQRGSLQTPCKLQAFARSGQHLRKITFKYFYFDLQPDELDALRKSMPGTTIIVLAE